MSFARSLPAPRSSTRFTIPADHPSGTFWYHPHKHGSVAYQMANGMAGALIVEGDGTAGKVRDLDSIPEIAGARERILVLQQLTCARTNMGSAGSIRTTFIRSRRTRKPIWPTAVNGVVMPTFTMHPKEVQRWRFIHAGREGLAPVMLVQRAGQATQEISRSTRSPSTVWRRGSSPPGRGFTLYPGNRSDVLVKAPGCSGTYYPGRASGGRVDSRPGAC